MGIGEIWGEVVNDISVMEYGRGVKSIVEVQTYLCYG